MRHITGSESHALGFRCSTVNSHISLCSQEYSQAAKRLEGNAQVEAADWLLQAQEDTETASGPSTIFDHILVRLLMDLCAAPSMLTCPSSTTWLGAAHLTSQGHGSASLPWVCCGGLLPRAVELATLRNSSLQCLGSISRLDEAVLPLAADF